MHIFKCFKLHYWSIFTAFVMTTSFVIWKAHQPQFSVSQRWRRYAPESCIFGQILNLGAFCFVVFVFIQFYATEFTITINKILISKKLNLLRLYIGLLVALGLSIVANFQETNILAIHSLGAAMTFFGGALYIVLHAIFTYLFKEIYYKDPQYHIGKKMVYFRVILAVASLVVASAAGTIFMLAVPKFTGKISEIALWNETHGGYNLKLISAYLEWVNATILFMYTCTASIEVKYFEYHKIHLYAKMSSKHFQNGEESLIIRV